MSLLFYIKKDWSVHTGELRIEDFRIWNGLERTLNSFTRYCSAFIETYYRVFFHWASPKKLKYGKPRLGESTLT